MEIYYKILLAAATIVLLVLVNVGVQDCLPDNGSRPKPPPKPNKF